MNINDPYEVLRKALATRDALTAELQDLRAKIAEASLVLDVPKAEMRLAEVTANITAAQDEAKAILTTAHAEAEAIRSRGSLDAEAAIAAANQNAGEIIASAEGQASEIVAQARARATRDAENIVKHATQLESQAQAVMTRAQRHAELLRSKVTAFNGWLDTWERTEV